MGLLSVLPGPSWAWRIGAYALLVATVFGFGWFKGSEHWHSVLIEAQAKAATEGVRIAKARETVTVRVVEKYLPAITKVETVTQFIRQEVPVYVQASDPPLGAGWRELHDAAATMRLPRPPGELDGGPVSAQDAADTVVANYGDCTKDQLKLKELQEWVREQQKVR